MKKAYIGIPGSGKTTKMIEDLTNFYNEKQLGNIVAYVEDSEVELYQKIMPNATVIGKNEASMTESIEIDTLIIDIIMMGNNFSFSGDLPKNVFWSFQSFQDVLEIIPKEKRKSYLKAYDFNSRHINGVVVIDVNDQEFETHMYELDKKC